MIITLFDYKNSANLLYENCLLYEDRKIKKKTFSLVGSLCRRRTEKKRSIVTFDS